MHNKLITAGIAALALALPSQALADVRACSTKVDWVAINPSGDLVVSLQGMGSATLCNVNGTINSPQGPVTSEVCRTYFAGFITVHAQNSTVTTFYNYGSAPAPQCDAMNLNGNVPANYPYFILFA